MKKIDLGQTVQIVANVGVIAGLIFLAVEIKQNNDLLESEATLVLRDNRIENSRRLLESPEFSNFLAKLASGEQLTTSEKLQETALYQSYLIHWQWEYNEFRNDRLNEDQLPTGAWSRIVHGNGELPTPGLLLFWDSWSKRLPDSDFVEFMEDNVVKR